MVVGAEAVEILRVELDAVEEDITVKIGTELDVVGTTAVFFENDTDLFLDVVADETFVVLVFVLVVDMSMELGRMDKGEKDGE